MIIKNDSIRSLPYARGIKLSRSSARQCFHRNGIKLTCNNTGTGVGSKPSAQEEECGGVRGEKGGRVGREFLERFPAGISIHFCISN